MSTRTPDHVPGSAIALGIALLVLVLLALSVPTMGPDGMGHYWSDGIALDFWLLGLGTLLVWALVVAGIGYVLHRTLATEPERVPDPAIEELRRAYARGDIGDEEFETRREKLEE